MNQMIQFAIPYDVELMARARTVPRAHWNPTLKLWTVPDCRAAWLALEESNLLGRIVAVVPLGGGQGALPRAFEKSERTKFANVDLVEAAHAAEAFAKTNASRAAWSSLEVIRPACADPIFLGREAPRLAVPKSVGRPMDVPGGLPSTDRVRASSLTEHQLGVAVRDREQTDFREVLMREGAAYTTIKSYVGIIRQLQAWWAGPLEQATRENLLVYQTYCIEEKRYSRATINQVVNGIRAYYERVLVWPKDELRLPRPRKKHTLPNVCTEAEVRRMLHEVDNRKHRTILTLVFALGLRKGEVQRLRVRDVQLERGVVHVHQAKGNKDRVLVLPASVVPILESYLADYNPDHWLFEGEDGGQYSGSSIQSIFVRAKERSRLPPQLTLHGLRHSYATSSKAGPLNPIFSSVEHGTPLHTVKELLGHSSILTTQIYLHTSSKKYGGLHDPLGML